MPVTDAIRVVFDIATGDEWVAAVRLSIAGSYVASRLSTLSVRPYCHLVMGFYIRKSVRAGPFRFNVSKSGIGVSAGVPGFRVGTGPRGNYVHAGRHGVYYRATLGGGGRNARPVSPPSPPAAFAPSDGVVLHDVTGASGADLLPTGPGDLVEQLNAAAGKHRLGPWAAGLLLVVIGAKPLVGVILLVPGLPLVAWLFLRDRSRRSVVAFYDVNDDVARWFEDLVSTFESLRGCHRLWRVNAAGRVETTYQYKVNSGASTIVSRSSASASVSPPAVLKTNIVVPTITAGRQALHFLPDRVLVREGRRFSDVAYASLEANGHTHLFIESSGVPRDGRQVDTTWQFVNVKGGPDRRYKNNRRLPVMLYGRLELASSGGLFWIVDTSKPDVPEQLAKALLAAPAVLQKIMEEPAELRPALAPGPAS